MPRHEQPVVPQRRLPPRGLLVLGLLIGLLGMHGLGFVPAAAQLNAPPSGSSAPGHLVAVMGVPDECGHHGDGGNGHPEHADSTCASGAVAGAPGIPAPLPSSIGDVPHDGQTVTVPWSRTGGCRAPPSPAELQLLRI